MTVQFSMLEYRSDDFHSDRKITVSCESSAYHRIKIFNFYVKFWNRQQMILFLDLWWEWKLKIDRCTSSSGTYCIVILNLESNIWNRISQRSFTNKKHSDCPGRNKIMIFWFSWEVWDKRRIVNVILRSQFHSRKILFCVTLWQK